MDSEGMDLLGCSRSTKCFLLFDLAGDKVVRASNLGLSVQDDGKKRPEKAGRLGGGAIDVLVNLCFTNIKLHVLSVH